MSDVYNVEKLIDHRDFGGNITLLVKWENYDHT